MDTRNALFRFVQEFGEDGILPIQFAERTGITVNHACKDLERLWRKNMLKRTGPKNKHYYWLSEGGKKYFAWLFNEAAKHEETRAEREAKNLQIETEQLLKTQALIEERQKSDLDDLLELMLSVKHEKEERERKKPQWLETLYQFLALKMMIEAIRR